MLKNKIKVNFVDFWPDFNIENNFILNILNQKYDVFISNDNPDLIFFSCFGINHFKYSCIKIFYTGENKNPNYFFCDFSFSFNDTNNKNLCLPHFVEYDHFFELQTHLFSPQILEYRNCVKEKFCNFIASNFRAKKRIEFVKKLLKYKKVDCLGPVLNNVQKEGAFIGKKNSNGEFVNWREEKLEIIKNYKFTIAFENEQAKNYVTEKIFQPLLIGSIPIYWGAPNISEYFNPNCYINVDHYKSFEELLDEIKSIENDPIKYKSFFLEKPILSTSKVASITNEYILKTIDSVKKNTKLPVGYKYRFLHRFLYVYYYIVLNILHSTKFVIKKIIKK